MSVQRDLKKFHLLTRISNERQQAAGITGASDKPFFREIRAGLINNNGKYFYAYGLYLQSSEKLLIDAVTIKYLLGLNSDPRVGRIYIIGINLPNYQALKRLTPDDNTPIIYQDTLLNLWDILREYKPMVSANKDENQLWLFNPYNQEVYGSERLNQYQVPESEIPF